MKVLDSFPLIKMAKDKTAEEKELLARYDGEYDDLVQMRSQGVKDSKAQGCMLGCWKENP